MVLAFLKELPTLVPNIVCEKGGNSKWLLKGASVTTKLGFEAKAIL